MGFPPFFLCSPDIQIKVGDGRGKKGGRAFRFIFSFCRDYGVQQKEKDAAPIPKPFVKKPKIAYLRIKSQ